MTLATSALLVIDVQNEVVASAHERDAVVANIGRAIDHARTTGLPVIWVQHSDEGLLLNSDGWQIVNELQPGDGEPRIHKLYRSSFESTELDDVLENLQITALYICGAETNNCVRWTSLGALERGFDVFILSDAHTTNAFEWQHGLLSAQQIIDEFNANMHRLQLPGRTSDLVSTESFCTLG